MKQKKQDNESLLKRILWIIMGLQTHLAAQSSIYFQTETVRSLGRYGLRMFVYSINSTSKKRGEKQDRNEQTDKDF